MLFQSIISEFLLEWILYPQIRDIVCPIRTVIGNNVRTDWGYRLSVTRLSEFSNSL
jgi:hypothetical protein